MTKHTGRAGPHRDSYIDDTGQAGYLVTMLNPTVKPHHRNLTMLVRLSYFLTLPPDVDISPQETPFVST